MNKMASHATVIQSFIKIDRGEGGNTYREYRARGEEDNEEYKETCVIGIRKGLEK